MKTLDARDAEKLARERVNALAHAAGDEFEIVSASTKSTDWGWLFFFDSRDYIRTGNPVDALAGNGPILVTPKGDIHQLPTAIPWEVAILSIRR